MNLGSLKRFQINGIWRNRFQAIIFVYFRNCRTIKRIVARDIGLMVSKVIGYKVAMLK